MQSRVFWGRLCRRGHHDRCIRRHFRRQPCPSKNDQSPPHSHASDGHSTMPVNRPNKNLCAGTAQMGPSAKYLAIALAPMAVVTLAPCITPGLPRSTAAVLTVTWPPLPHALAIRSKKLSSVLNSPNPAPRWTLSQSKSTQTCVSGSYAGTISW